MTGRHVAPRVLLTGAQTGGHLYPAIALGRFLLERGIEVVLVTSGEAVERQVLEGASVPVEVLRVGKWKGMGLRARVKGLAGLPGALLRARALVRRIGPAAAVGFGGYTTGPVMLAAALGGVPTAICEENAVPGMTNRLLARFVDVAFVPSELAATGLACRRAVVSGVPVRPEILAVRPRDPREEPRRVLVLGGSQGSAFLNARIPPVLARVAAAVPGLQVIHQTGKGRREDVAGTYRDLGLDADVREYLPRVSEAYAWADLVVARAGAGTVSEVSAVGIPALFVPFAAATDDHQAANARPIVDAGGAFMVREEEFQEEQVAGTLAGVLRDPERLREMGRCCRSRGRRDAIEVIGRQVLEWTERKDA
ncbi:MAG TPA: undecaprenyldiphospho-muramoylpentapeptide beta-N-acetylglucosaminyltransferase [Myxococcota bacterium]|nr:undecaprenyldiphospho-muramoylpentapeptide beta-N-acetylglucosaminyltransferase [Myxococcota bacterium]HQK49609.1 undecaprenyldiphospho-muramoylpentapeptide beta-N-acetylglucosaminyltransferase [Myxococcota bacterium]